MGWRQGEVLCSRSNRKLKKRRKTMGFGVKQVHRSCRGTAAEKKTQRAKAVSARNTRYERVNAAY